MWHILALDIFGSVLSCGSNKNGELGRRCKQENYGKGFKVIKRM